MPSTASVVHPSRRDVAATIVIRPDLPVDAEDTHHDQDCRRPPDRSVETVWPLATACESSGCPPKNFRYSARAPACSHSSAGSVSGRAGFRRLHGFRGAGMPESARWVGAGAAVGQSAMPMARASASEGTFRSRISLRCMGLGRDRVFSVSVRANTLALNQRGRYRSRPRRKGGRSRAPFPSRPSAGAPAGTDAPSRSIHPPAGFPGNPQARGASTPPSSRADLPQR